MIQRAFQACVFLFPTMHSSFNICLLIHNKKCYHAKGFLLATCESGLNQGVA